MKLLGAGAAGILLPGGLSGAVHAQTDLPPEAAALRRTLERIIGQREIGLDLRRLDARPEFAGEEYFRIQINADKLYPTASCFKSFAVLYYLWNTPQDEWRIDEGSNAYRIAVYSSNTLTTTLLMEMNQRITYFGNAIEKFNDFLIYTLEMEHGIYSWNWGDNSPLEFYTDRRFVASDTRLVNVRGLNYRMDNLTTAADLSRGYVRMLDPTPFQYFNDQEHARAAIDATLDLLTIPAEDYQSPFERVFPEGYTGKDGVLPSDTSAIGRVINDAGIIRLDDAVYVMSFLCAGEGEYVGLGLLAQIADAMRAFTEDYPEAIYQRMSGRT